uniref:Uncharacterized protein n=2 Tax=Oryza sativa subsp. japonica TaxID=39947 RepID=Q10NG9_ORYSJ|nr:hypothetical protein [Oryza sativa Japonica Group]ABF95193.1 transposon protein, putative, unclassified [Oryza sativa Japonica Group]
MPDSPPRRAARHRRAQSEIVLGTDDIASDADLGVFLFGYESKNDERFICMIFMLSLYKCETNVYSSHILFSLIYIKNREIMKSRQSHNRSDRACQGYGYHIPNSSCLNLGRTHYIPCPIRKQPSDIGGVPDKERQPKFYMETTSTTRIVSILVSLVLLGQGDTYGYKYKLP